MNLVRRKIEAIFIDVDGCLLPTDGDVSPVYFLGLNQISQYVKEANQGNFPKIGFCTGRDRNYVEAVSFFTGLPNSWSVIESGIAIFNPTTKELILNPVLTPKIGKAFVKMSEEKVPQILKRYPELFLYPGNMINIALERRYGTDLSIEECYEVVKKELEGLLEERLIIVTHSHIAVDISPAGIDKASGMEFLSKYAGINLAKSLGIGDSKGDFPMMKLVGYVGGPSNASKECKELITAKEGYISQFKYANGVADVISYFVEGG